MQLELRLILLAIGLVIIGLIYVWGMRKKIKASLERRRRLKKQRGDETLMDALRVIDPNSTVQPQPSSDEAVFLDEVDVRVVDNTDAYQASRDPLATELNAPKYDSPYDSTYDSPDYRASGDESPEFDVSKPSESETEKPDVMARDTVDSAMPAEPAQSQPDQYSEPDAAQAADADNSMTVLLTVIAPKDQPFAGPSIRKVARELALPIGKLGVLECNTDTGEGKVMKTVFSIAHLREPGIFDEASIDKVSTPGLLLFMQLPGPLPATEAVRMMFGVAGQLAEKLGGTVCDEKRRRFTREGYVELHRRASRFEQASLAET